MNASQIRRLERLEAAFVAREARDARNLAVLRRHGIDPDAPLDAELAERDREAFMRRHGREPSARWLAGRDLAWRLLSADLDALAAVPAPVRRLALIY